MPAVLTDLFGAVTANSDPRIVGNLVTGLRIFRSGSFADSEGTRRRFTRSDLDKMVENYNHLVDNGILPNVPVREDHSRSITSVVGYFVGVRRDGNFLVADIEFTEDRAVSKYTSKTYRARSAEVGTYTDNQGNEFSPCILGVAFCDIPAVEGLYSAQIAAYAPATSAGAVRKPASQQTKPGGSSGAVDPSWRFDPMTGERIAPADAEGNDGDSLMKDVLLDLHNLKDLYAGDPDTESSLQQIVDALNSILQDSDAPDDSAHAGPTGTSSTKSTQTGRPAQHSHSEDSVALIQFALGGATVEVDEKYRDGMLAVQSAFAAAESRATKAENDFANAAKERDELRESVTKIEFSVRDAKVDGWLKDGKLLPAQVDGTKAFCRLLTADQFAAHEALMTGAPVSAIATGAASGSPATPEGDDKATKIKYAKQGYAMLKTTGVTGDKLTNSKFAKDLKALGIDPEGA